MQGIELGATVFGSDKLLVSESELVLDDDPNPREAQLPSAPFER